MSKDKNSYLSEDALLSEVITASDRRYCVESQASYKSGEIVCQRIVVEYLHGQMDFVPWAACFDGYGGMTLVNLAHVESVDLYRPELHGDLPELGDALNEDDG